MKYNPDYPKVHAFICDLMQKVRNEPVGCFKYPTINTTAGIFYSAFIFTWDCHHMTLRYAAAGEPEYMKYFLLTILEFQKEDGYTSCCVNSQNGISFSSGFHA